MLISKLYLPALLTMLSACVPSIYAADFDMLPSQDFNHSATSQYMRSPTITHDIKGLQTMNGSVSQRESESSSIIGTFLKDGILQNPLPSKETVLEDLLDSGLITNISEIINQAYDSNSISMALLGGFYYRSVDLDKAQSFLFRSAMAHNPEAFWLLSSMCRNLYITSLIPNLDSLLLNEAEKLGSADAKRYKQESGLI